MSEYTETDPVAEARAIAEFSASMGVPVDEEVIDDAAAVAEKPEGDAAAVAEKPDEAAAAAAAAAAGDDEDLIDAEGKLLGKFDTPEEMAKSHKSLQTDLDAKSAAADLMRQTLAAAGYTFTASGEPVAPAAPPATAAAAAETPAAAATQEQGEVNPLTGNRIDPESGFDIDQTGCVLIPDDAWEKFYEEDPAATAILHNKYLFRRSQAEQAYNAQQTAQAGTHRESVKAAITERVSPAIADEVDLAMQGAVYDNPNIAPHLKTNVEYLNLMSKAIAGDIILRKFPDLVGEKASAAAEAAAKGRTVHAVAKGKTLGSAPGAAAAPAAATPPADESYGLSEEEKTMARSLGVTNAEYAEYK